MFLKSLTFFDDNPEVSNWRKLVVFFPDSALVYMPVFFSLHSGMVMGPSKKIFFTDNWFLFT